MNRIAMCATFLCGAIAIPAAAQGPAAGVRFHLQLISADTGVVAVDKAQPLLTARKGSSVYVKCVRPDSGKWQRESPECGPRVSDLALKVLAESTVTSDAQGHVSERLSWSGGDAVVELDASDRSLVGSTERMRIKVGFWPRLAKGAAAIPEAALRMSNPTATVGWSLTMTVLYKDGAQILLIVPER